MATGTRAQRALRCRPAVLAHIKHFFGNPVKSAQARQANRAPSYMGTAEVAGLINAIRGNPTLSSRDPRSLQALNSSRRLAATKVAQLQVPKKWDTGGPSSGGAPTQAGAESEYSENLPEGRARCGRPTVGRAG